ncbi:hypothetical protein PAMP_011121 [Pampus punctatissimus]
MGFGDDVAAVDAASSSHFVPLSAMMRNYRMSDRPVPGESRGPEWLLTAIYCLYSMWLDNASSLAKRKFVQSLAVYPVPNRGTSCRKVCN